MYSFDEIIPFIFSDVDEEPYLKSELFSPEIALELEDAFSELSRNPYGDLTITLEEFTTTNDKGEERTFEAHTFNLHVNDNIRILDESCEGKVWAHYETSLTDVDTKEKFKLYAYYYESNYDFIGISVEKVVVKAKKAKKIKTHFVLTEKKSDGYEIHGIFKSLDSAIEAFEQEDLFMEDIDSFQVEEVPIESLFKNHDNLHTKNFILGALNIYDLTGESL